MCGSLTNRIFAHSCAAQCHNSLLLLESLNFPSVIFWERKVEKDIFPTCSCFIIHYGFSVLSIRFKSVFPVICRLETEHCRVKVLYCKHLHLNKDCVSMSWNIKGIFPFPDAHLQSGATGNFGEVGIRTVDNEVCSTHFCSSRTAIAHLCI